MYLFKMIVLMLFTTSLFSFSSKNFTITKDGYIKNITNNQFLYLKDDNKLALKEGKVGSLQLNTKFKQSLSNGCKKDTNKDLSLVQLYKRDLSRELKFMEKSWREFYSNYLSNINNGRAYKFSTIDQLHIAARYEVKKNSYNKILDCQNSNEDQNITNGYLYTQLVDYIVDNKTDLYFSKIIKQNNQYYLPLKIQNSSNLFKHKDIYVEYQTDKNENNNSLNLDIETYFKNLEKTLQEGKKVSIEEFDKLIEDEKKNNNKKVQTKKIEIEKPKETKDIIPLKKLFESVEQNKTKRYKLVIKNNQFQPIQKDDNFEQYNLLIYIPKNIKNRLDIDQKFLDNFDKFLSKIKESYDQIDIRVSNNSLTNYKNINNIKEILNQNTQNDDFDIEDVLKQDSSKIIQSYDNFDLIYFDNFDNIDTDKLQNDIEIDDPFENKIFVSLNQNSIKNSNDSHKYKIDTSKNNFQTFETVIDITK